MAMLMADPFVHLPASLARSILSNWLKAKSLSKLDVAYCNHGNRSAFLEILDDSELSAKDNRVKFTHIEKDMGRLRWMNMRNVKCSTFIINIFDTISSSDESVLISFIQRVAKRLKCADISAPISLLDTLLPVIDAAKCSFATYSLDIFRERDDPTPQLDAAAVQILANSSEVLTNLRVFGSIEWKKHWEEGVRLPVLREASVTICRDSDLVCFCKAAPNIIKLSLDHPRCTSIGFAAIGQHCRALETLNVHCRPNKSDRRGVTDLDVAIAAMAKGCVKLRRIFLRSCWELTDVGLTALQALSATLVHVHLSECPGITGSGIVAIATHCKLLHTFIMEDNTYRSVFEPDELVEALPHMHNMTKLVLRYIDIDEEMVQLITQHTPLLQHLDLGVENVAFYDDDDFGVYTSADLISMAQKCEKLQYLELPDWALNDVTRELLLKSRPGVVIMIRMLPIG